MLPRVKKYKSGSLVDHAWTDDILKGAYEL